MSTLLACWLEHYDSIHRGWTPRGIANGVCATNGFAFPRVAGGYNLYRRDVDAAFVEIVGASGAHADCVANFAWAAADALAAVRFELRSIGGGGVESAPSAIGVDVQFDETGEPNALKPNTPQDLSIKRRAEGRFELKWRYDERRQEAAPVSFAVFSDNGTGVVDYESAVGEVVYYPRQVGFSFLSDAFDHSVSVRFVVRAVAADGSHDGNTTSVMQWADATPPALPTVVLADVVEAL
ncbi:MAG: hypothetical protein R3E58_14390 [Phycisphaerae bacterium]|nr:hypothetical protein [Phycisphaerales bacterium]